MDIHEDYIWQNWEVENAKMAVCYPSELNASVKGISSAV